MSRVMSKDGTEIAYEKSGRGPAVILVDGAMGYRGYMGMKPLAAELAKNFTAVEKIVQARVAELGAKKADEFGTRLYR